MICLIAYQPPYRFSNGGGAHGEIDIIVWISILYSINILRKPNNSPSNYVYIVGQTGLFNLAMATGLGEGKLWIETMKLCLKIDLMSPPACVEGLVYIYIYIYIPLLIVSNFEE